MRWFRIILVLSFCCSAPDGLAQTHSSPESIRRIGETQAYQELITVSLFPGRSVMIDFRNGEMISFVQVSDPTYVLFQTNAPIETGNAKTIVLRLSEGIRFEHLTQSEQPNLIVTTTRSDGTSHTYSFDLQIRSGQPVAGQNVNGIAIVPSTEMGEGNTIQTSLGVATLEDLATGLRLAIEQGYTTTSDPIVAQIEELLARSRNGESLIAVARTEQISMRLLSALGEIALAAKQPSSRSPAQSESSQSSSSPPHESHSSQ